MLESDNPETQDILAGIGRRQLLWLCEALKFGSCDRRYTTLMLYDMHENFS
jgi:branched-subunit amino acid aminotransferase/4-amino-4-deoxychorismate lyase